MLFRMAGLIYHFLMQPRALIQFLTFVLTGLLALATAAAPSTEISPDRLKPAHPPAAPNSTLDTDSVHITPAPLDENGFDPERIRPTRIVRERSLNLSLGLASGPLREKEPTEQTQIYGLGATFAQPQETANELTVVITENGLLGGQGQYKKYCCLGEFNEPYWTVGASGLYNPSELLAGFVKIGSYQVLAGGGLEDLFRLKRRVRLEGLVGLGTRGMSLYLRIGYAFDESVLSF